MAARALLSSVDQSANVPPPAVVPPVKMRSVRITLWARCSQVLMLLSFGSNPGTIAALIQATWRGCCRTVLVLQQSLAVLTSATDLS